MTIKKIDSHKIAEKLREYRSVNQLDIEESAIALNIPPELISARHSVGGGTPLKGSVEGALEEEEISTVSPQTLAKIAIGRGEDVNAFFNDVSSDGMAVEIKFDSRFVKVFNWFGIKKLPKWLQKLEERKVLSLQEKGSK